MTQIAIASSSRNSCGVEVAELILVVLITPANAARIEHRTKASSLVRPTLIPRETAASRLPPTAKKWLPSRWRSRNSHAATASPMNQRNWACMIEPMRPVRASSKPSGGKKLSGRLLAMIRPLTRRMNSIPIVAMNDGIPNRTVMIPFTMPTRRPVARAARTDSESGTPFTKAKTMT